MAIFLTKIHAATGERVLITATGVYKHGCATGKRLFQFQLSKARIISTPCCETESRGVAGISKQYGHQGSIWSRDLKHRDAVVDGAGEGDSTSEEIRDICFPVVSAIHGKGSLPLTVVEGCGRQIGKSVFHELNGSLHHLVGVVIHKCFLCRVNRVVVDQVIPKSRATVIMRKGEHQL